MRLKARDVMTTEVISVTPDTLLTEAARRLMTGRFSGMPVINSRQKLVGAITQHEILAHAGSKKFAFLKTSDVMVPDTTSVDAGLPLADVINLVIRGNIAGLPVTQKGKLVGMIGRRDLLRSYFPEDSENHALAFVVSTTQALLSARSLRQLMIVLVDKIGSFFEANRCSVIKIGEPGKNAVVLATYEDRSVRDLVLNLGKYPEIVQAYRTGKPVIIKNPLRDPVMKSVSNLIRSLHIRNIFVFPIILKDKVVGTLCLRTNLKKHSSEGDIKAAEMIANIAAGAIKAVSRGENYENLYKDFEKKSTIDELTGLYNRRFLSKRLSEEFGIAQRHSVPLSCILFDIDNFKTINDAFGHEAGDMILQTLASFLRKTVRISDVIVRYGGDEFLLLLPVTDEKGALREAQRIRRALSTLKCGPQGKRIYVSIGVASFPVPGIKKADDLIKNADKAMYEAKRAGRNCIIVYDGTRRKHSTAQSG